MSDAQRRIGVLGLGHVGLPTAAALSPQRVVPESWLRALEAVASRT